MWDFGNNSVFIGFPKIWKKVPLDANVWLERHSFQDTLL